MGQVGLEWQVAGFGDFSTRANETDMLMRNSNTGAFEVYDIAITPSHRSPPMGQVGLEWTIAGFGDFSGNANETDMLMRNSNTGVFELYDISNNAITSSASMGQVGLEWSVSRRIGQSDERATRHAAQRRCCRSGGRSASSRPPSSRRRWRHSHQPAWRPLHPRRLSRQHSRRQSPAIC